MPLRYLGGEVHLLLTIPTISCYAKDLKIISLSPAITKEIFLLGSQKYLVGCSSYAVLPKWFKLKRVGSVTNANIEEIIRLKPNYVFASGILNPRTVKKMRSLGIDVVVFDYPKSFKQICDQFVELGSYLGKRGEALKIVRKAEIEVMNIYYATKGLGKVKVFVEIGTHPLFTANRDSFINDFIRFAGGINIAADSKSGLYSVEEVLRKNPDAIIISQMGFNGYLEKERWGKFKFLGAVKNKKILILSGPSLCSPTPLSFVKTLKKIAHFLHPEVKLKVQNVSHNPLPKRNFNKSLLLLEK